MKTKLLLFLLTSFIIFNIALSYPSGVISNSYPAPVQNIFMQGNNINTVFRTDGIFNYDWVTFTTKEAGMIWPVTAPGRTTINYTSGIYIGARVILPNNQKETRLAASMYNTHFTPGNIPVVGQIPPQSVCSDPKWRGYYVQLTDPSLVNGGTRVKIGGGRQYTFNYDPWSLWPVNLGAPYVEVNGIAGYQPGWNADRPGIGNGSTARPDELLYMTFMDYTNCTSNMHLSEISLPGGSLPLGVEVQLMCFMFNCQGYKDMYFMKWRILNKSGRQWDSTYFAIADDIDIGDGTAPSRDDAVGCDTAREMGFIYNCDNTDPNYGTNPPCCGIRLLQSPLRFTGSNSDTARLPYDTLIGYKILGMSSFVYFVGSAPDPCYYDPDNFVSGYNFMRGMDGCGRPRLHPATHQPTLFSYSGDACNRVGWFDSSCRDVRLLMSSGPFVMNSLDTQIAVIACIVGFGSNNFQNVCNLQASSDSALKYYYEDFKCNSAIGIKPISSNVPQRYALYQNYPNPFNPVTKIKFDVPRVETTRRVVSTRLTVYDLLGKEIAALVNESLEPGSYEIEWDASSYSSGLYLYRLESGDYTETKKMLLLK